MTMQTHCPTTSWQPWARLLAFVWPYRLWLTVAIGAACTLAGLNIGFAFLTRHLTDAALTMQTQRFFALLYLAAVPVLVGLLATYSKRYATSEGCPEPPDSAERTALVVLGENKL